MSLIILPNKDGVFEQPTSSGSLTIKGQYKQNLLFGTLGTRQVDFVTGAPYSGAPLRRDTKYGNAIAYGQLPTLGRSFVIPANSDFTIVWAGRSVYRVYAANNFIFITTGFNLSLKFVSGVNRLALTANSTAISVDTSVPTIANSTESVYACRFKNATSADFWWDGSQKYSVSHAVNMASATLTKIGNSTGEQFGDIAALYVWDRYLDDTELVYLLKEPYSLFSEDGRHTNTVYFIPASGATSHNATGVLVGQGAIIAGAAQHNVAHSSAGDLAGQGATLTGSATRFHEFASSGVLTGQGAILNGSAIHNVTHTSSGDLIGQGASISGDADRQGPGTVSHTSSGALSGQGATLSGSSARFHEFSAYGMLVGQGAEISGLAIRNATHAASGTLVGQGAILSGSALHNSLHTSTGALIGQGAVIDGSALNSGAATLTPQDLANIADAVWAHSSAINCQLLLEETWGRLGLDPANPLVTGQTQITFGAIVMAMTTIANTVTLTRQ